MSQEAEHVDRSGGMRALTYFPVDDRYRITVPRLRRPPPGDRPVALDTSDGLGRIARRLALLDFDLHGQRLTLTAFGFGPTERGTLFVPFADATSGTETYGNGRYLDLEIEPDGSAVLDSSGWGPRAGVLTAGTSIAMAMTLIVGAAGRPLDEPP